MEAIRFESDYLRENEIVVVLTLSPSWDKTILFIDTKEGIVNDERPFKPIMYNTIKNPKYFNINNFPYITKQVLIEQVLRGFYN